MPLELCLLNFFSYLFLLSYLICSHHATPPTMFHVSPAPDAKFVRLAPATRYTVRKCILCLEYSKHLDQDLFNLKSIYKLQLHDGLAIHLRNFCTIIFHCFIPSRSTAIHQFSVTYFIYSSPRFLMLPPPLWGTWHPQPPPTCRCQIISLVPQCHAVLLWFATRRQAAMTPLLGTTTSMTRRPRAASTRPWRPM